MTKYALPLAILIPMGFVLLFFQNCAKAPSTANEPSTGARTLIGQASNGSAYYMVEAPNAACIDLYKEGTKIYSCQHGYDFIYSNQLIDSGTGAYGRLLSLNGTLLHEGYHSAACTNVSGCSADCTFTTGASSTGPLTLNLCQ